ncbi:hypothetical protein LCGC14_0898580 [marine sediment metagenome]|uniref:Uncharacterized protein n=1 Tax=marine sediment metagenome TaxID=412755 RepID=A0A0F9PHV6_9ZZZZ
MSTVNDLATAALSRAADFGAAYPGSRSVLYRRLSNRLHQLYAAAARWNPEYFGVSAVGTLDSGGVSFSTMGASGGTYAPELVSRIEIADKGTSSYTNGDEVNLVQLNDPDAALPPRVMVRNQALQQVGTDLTDVTSLRMYYSRRPFRLAADDGDTTVDFPEQFEELLVIDLTKWITRKATNPPLEQRAAALASLDAEEQETLANFEQEVVSFTSAAETGRFMRTAGQTRQ